MGPMETCPHGAQMRKNGPPWPRSLSELGGEWSRWYSAGCPTRCSERRSVRVRWPRRLALRLRMLLNGLRAGR